MLDYNNILKTVGIIGSILLGFGCLFLICKCKFCNNIKMNEQNNDSDKDAAYTRGGCEAETYTLDNMHAQL